MAKDSKSAAEQQSAGNQSPEATGQGAGNDELSSLRAEVAELRSQLQASGDQAVESQQLRNEVAELRAALRELRETRLHPVNREPVRERPQEKLERRIREAQEARERVDVELARGPRKFQVSMAGEARMTRTVGAADVHEARAKYIGYFGIRGTSKEISVSEIVEEQTAAAK